MLQNLMIIRRNDLLENVSVVCSEKWFTILIIIGVLAPFFIARKQNALVTFTTVGRKCVKDH